MLLEVSKASATGTESNMKRPSIFWRECTRLFPQLMQEKETEQSIKLQ